ncbi:multiple sugar transport system permease protein [Glycomyces sambucus]|uniref:Multiple sugar transport system permease protein n=1 Tax=Glycomyces sambucus TaxID=380244 RepID=A0A1G9HTA1_9ACTN|nr:sugar ABC transporter permease [Glycomyces sambucus]SDL16191.1 multiple sugar transport system permease protein [Glycomyces sambucus]
MSTESTAPRAQAALPVGRIGQRGRANKGGKGPRYARTGYLFVAPFMIGFTAMFLVPLAYAAWFSLFREQMIGGNVFVGLDNYTRAFTDPQLIAGLGRVALFFLIQVPLMMVLALFFALALDSALLRLSRTIRLAIFMPYAVPSVVAALMWGFLYGPDFGPLAQLADRIGAAAPDFLGADLMLGSIANIVTWEFTGYNMILLYAALRAIPTELYEAAAVDGAGPWRTAWSIKIPLLRPAIVLCMVFSVIGSFQLFNEPSIMRTLAPNVIVADYTPNLYAYNLAFVGQEYNYAAAVSFVLGFVIMAGSYLFMLATNRRSRS